MVLPSILKTIFLIIAATATAAFEPCEWIDGERDFKPAIIVSGSCNIQQIIHSDYIEKQDQGSLLISASVFILPGSRLTIQGTDFENVKLLSSPTVYVKIIAEGSELIIADVNVSSYNPLTGLPDEILEDGRAFIRVDAFIDSYGNPRNGYIDITNSNISYLGYNSIGRNEDVSAYGLSLKVRKEHELDHVRVNGRIQNSTLSYNYRGYYSYGARGVLFDANYVHHNHDYGVDPHDDSDGFIATNNTIVDNGGTGFAMSRRCNSSIVSNNLIARNGKNGILIHDLSNSVKVFDNVVEDNRLDGIVIHDSNQIEINRNFISNNRNGIRVFAGSTGVDITENQFDNNRRAEIFFLNGNLDAVNDFGDYSIGAHWNSKNISRHNDSRVRLASIDRNIFETSAVIELIESEIVSFTDNYYVGNVLFDIKNSNRISLDGVQSQGHVVYRMRSAANSSNQYAINPKLGSELSVLGGDQVHITSDGAFLPASNSNFTLEFRGNGEQVISTALSDGKKIQTGILKEIPIKKLEGELLLSSYIGDFAIDGTARIELVSNDWAASTLLVRRTSCSVVKLEIENRYLTAFSPNVFYVQTGVGFKLEDILAGSGGRVVIDMTCIQS